LYGVGTFTLTGSEIATITLTGTEGAANITVNGLTCTATFAADLDTTAANFVEDFAADYLDLGIVVTAGTASLIFTLASGGCSHCKRWRG
jgi:hypothetical protein